VALDATITPVPEPGTIAMLLTGLLAGAAVRRSVRQSFPMHGAVAA
jgi:hypothetical protein